MPAGKRKRRKRRGMPLSKALPLALAMGLICALAPVLFSRFMMVRVRFNMPDGTQLVQPMLRGEGIHNAPTPELEGYRFTGWEGEDGELARLEDPIESDQVFTPRMMPLFKTEEHSPYLAVDENGLLHPDETVTRGEAAQILYTFISVIPRLNGNYADVPTGYAYAGAVSVLKALKVVPGERFRPTEEATLRELVGMLGCFYPLLSDAELVMDDGTGDGQSPRYRFADLSQSDPDYRLFCTAVSLGWLDDDPEQPLEPDKPLTRARCAALINRVMGRGTGLEVDESIAGKVADVPPDHPYYTDLMEAVVPHSYAMEGGKERWSDSEPFASKLGEGLLFVGPQMYCVGADGYLLLDESWHGFDFGPDGRYTSGNEELDDLVREALGDILTPGMTGDQKLRAAYDYTVHSFTYTKGEHHERGDVSWAEDAAIEMLSQGHSNCYGYAAVFYQMARALGRDAALVSGLYGENYVYHAWVEFEVDGTTYICDPEIEMTYVREGLEDNVDMFMMLPGYADIFGYTK